MSAGRAYTRSSRIARRVLQVSVFAFLAYGALGGPWRNYKLAHNLERLVAMIEGPVWGALYGANDRLLSFFGDAYEASFSVLGTHASATVFGLETMDPILALSQVVGGTPRPVALLVAALVPLALALALGKVFCSHLCPMRTLFELAQALRRGSMRLGVPLPDLELHRGPRLGGFVLAGGLVGAAISGAALWYWLIPYLALGGAIFLGLTTGAAGTLGVLAGLQLLFDGALAPGYICHNLCPTGFLLERVGRRSLLRIQKRDTTPCPRSCSSCILRCPYGLEPKRLASGGPDPNERSLLAGCDACGACTVACPSQKLERTLVWPTRPKRSRGPAALLLAGALLGGLGLAEPAAAHHNKGMPHYGYFENYPQVPTEEYLTVDGGFEMGATIFNFQGLDRRTADTPNDVKIFVYLYDQTKQEGYTGPARFEIWKGDTRVAEFRREKVDEEAVYSTRETLPESGDYLLIAHFADGSGDPSSERSLLLPFHIDLAGGGLGAPTVLAGLALVGIAALVARLGRRRAPRARRRPAQGRPA